MMQLVFSTTTSLLVCGMLLGACSSSDGGGNGGADAAPQKPLARLFINELQPSNQDTITDEAGEADDWIEIYNDSDVAIEMQGYSFADSSGLAQTLTGSVLVQPRAFKLFWADGSPKQGVNHLGFKLSASGDKVTLKDTAGRTVDNVSFGAASGQSTYARFPDGTGALAWCGSPTPGVSNGVACAAAPVLGTGGTSGSGGSTGTSSNGGAGGAHDAGGSG
jgi:hypothetical protein